MSITVATLSSTTEIRGRVPYPPPSSKGQPPPPSGRRLWLLRRLGKADGPTYDDLCREVIAACTNGSDYIVRVRGVRAVRWLLWHGEASTAPDESVWLTSKGWRNFNAANGNSHNGSGAVVFGPAKGLAGLPLARHPAARPGKVV